jgi:hypothetical protein
MERPRGDAYFSSLTPEFCPNHRARSNHPYLNLWPCPGSFTVYAPYLDSIFITGPGDKIGKLGSPKTVICLRINQLPKKNRNYFLGTYSGGSQIGRMPRAKGRIFRSTSRSTLPMPEMQYQLDHEKDYEGRDQEFVKQGDQPF